MCVRALIISLLIGPWASYAAGEDPSPPACPASLEVGAGLTDDAVVELARSAALEHLRATHDTRVYRASARVRSLVRVTGGGYSTIVDLNFLDAGISGISQNVSYDVLVAASGATVVHDDH